MTHKISGLPLVRMTKLNLEMAPISEMIMVSAYDNALMFSYFYECDGITNWRLPTHDEFYELLTHDYYCGFWYTNDITKTTNAEHTVHLVRNIAIV